VLTIEIRKTGFVNKGAELMFLACFQFVKQQFPNARVAMEPYHSTAPYEKRAKYQLWQKPRLFRAGIQFGVLTKLMPPVLRKMLGIVTDDEIDVVLDASGFSYSDQWGTASTAELNNSVQRWKKNKTTVILLPQAFGPFELGKNKANIAAAVSKCDLVYVRDKRSLDYLKSAVGNTACNFRLSPDFTNLLDATPSDLANQYKNQVCIVPNFRMLDKTDKSQAEQYLTDLTTAIAALKAREKSVYFLVHDSKLDLWVCEQINSRISFPLPILQHDDPLVLKGILKESLFVIGSRFHALISALSQGVPCIGIGWSHKYSELMKDYGIPQFLHRTGSGDISYLIHQLLDADKYGSIRSTVADHAVKQKEIVKSMWQEVATTIRTSHAR